MDFLAKKITATGIGVLGLIVAFAVFRGQWEQTLLLFFLWLAAVVASSCGWGNKSRSGNTLVCVTLPPVFLSQVSLKEIKTVYSIRLVTASINSKDTVVLCN
jgi:hypothetical protein